MLAYHGHGEGTPVVCPGGLMQDSGYLGNLGGLSRRLQLIRSTTGVPATRSHPPTPTPIAATGS